MKILPDLEKAIRENVEQLGIFMELVRTPEKLKKTDEIGKKALKDKHLTGHDITWNNISAGERAGTSGANAKAIYTSRRDEKAKSKEIIAAPKN